MRSWTTTEIKKVNGEWKWIIYRNTREAITVLQSSPSWWQILLHVLSGR